MQLTFCIEAWNAHFLHFLLASDFRVVTKSSRRIQDTTFPNLSIWQQFTHTTLYLPLPHVIKGAFNNYVQAWPRGQNFAIFWPQPSPCPLRWQLIYPDRGQKQTFFDPQSSHFVHAVSECSLIYFKPALKNTRDLRARERLELASSVNNKVITDKSRGEVSLFDQHTIKKVS